MRKIPLANAQVHAGTWKMPAVVPIHRLRGSVLGLVGFGRIPQLVAPKAKAFGMRVIAFDPYVPPDVFQSAGVERVEFAELLKIVGLRVDSQPADCPRRKGMFNADAFTQMKPAATWSTPRAARSSTRRRWRRRSTRATSPARRSTS